MNEAPVRVRVLGAVLDAKTLEVLAVAPRDDFSEAEVGRLAEGFCPIPLSSSGHPPELRLLVAPNGWAYCPFGIEWACELVGWKLEGVEGPGLAGAPVPRGAPEMP